MAAACCLRASQRERDPAISQREIEFELRPRELIAGGGVPLGGDGDVEREEEVRRRGLRLHLRGAHKGRESERCVAT